MDQIGEIGVHLALYTRNSPPLVGSPAVGIAAN